MHTAVCGLQLSFYVSIYVSMYLSMRLFVRPYFPPTAMGKHRRDGQCLSESAERMACWQTAQAEHVVEGKHGEPQQQGPFSSRRSHYLITDTAANPLLLLMLFHVGTRDALSYHYHFSVDLLV